MFYRASSTPRENFNVADFENSAAMTMLRPILSGFKVAIHINTPGKVIKDNGIDAVLITRVTGTEQNVHYSGGSMGYPGYYGGMYSYYYGAYSSPGYVTTSTTVRLETNVYAVSTEKLTWAGITETFSPSNLEREVQELAGVLIKSMSQSGLL